MPARCSPETRSVKQMQERILLTSKRLHTVHHTNLRGSNCAELEPVASVRERRGSVSVFDGQLDGRQHGRPKIQQISGRHIRLVISSCTLQWYRVLGIHSQD